MPGGQTTWQDPFLSNTLGGSDYVSIGGTPPQWISSGDVRGNDQNVRQKIGRAALDINQACSYTVFLGTKPTPNGNGPFLYEQANYWLFAGMPAPTLSTSLEANLHLFHGLGQPNVLTIGVNVSLNVPGGGTQIINRETTIPVNGTLDPAAEFQFIIDSESGDVFVLWDNTVFGQAGGVALPDATDVNTHIGFGLRQPTGNSTEVVATSFGVNYTSFGNGNGNGNGDPPPDDPGDGGTVPGGPDVTGTMPVLRGNVYSFEEASESFRRSNLINLAIAQRLFNLEAADKGGLYLEGIASGKSPTLNDVLFFAKTSGDNIELRAKGSTGDEVLLHSVRNKAHVNAMELNWIE